MNTLEHDIFLCHNGTDKDWVVGLAERLEAESIDGTEEGRRIRVFLDVWDVEKGENIVLRLGQELVSGSFVAAVMSPEFFGSNWTRFEWTDIVARDPVNTRGRLLPLRLRDISLDGATRISFPPPFNALRHFDFRAEAHFEREFQDLLRRIRGHPLPRGRQLPSRYSSSVSLPVAQPSNIETAEAVSEILLSNLFPLVGNLPPLYVAAATIASLSELPTEAGFESHTLKIWSGKVVTFSDLEDPECLLNRIIDPHTIQRMDFPKCAGDQDLTNMWLALANKHVASTLRQKGITVDEKGRFYFQRDPKQDIRYVKIGSAKRRAVAAKKKHHASGEEFWVHYSATIKFRVIGKLPFLRLLPSYGFTQDGIVALGHKQASRFRVMWSGKQDSATVLRQLLFWLQFMADGHEECILETGGTPLRISVIPASTDTQVGIASDHIQIKALMEGSTDEELATVLDTAEFGGNEAEDRKADDSQDEDGEEV